MVKLKKFITMTILKKMCEFGYLIWLKLGVELKKIEV
jgi:hypothetical protein